jgi:5-methylcytosine-specific restriction protein B
MATSTYSWVPFYEELADVLSSYRARQSFLIEFLKAQRDAGLPITPLADRDAEGRKSLLTVLDPFTFFGTFNRRVKEKNQAALLDAIKRTFEVKADLPRGFGGIPTLHRLNSWFFSYAPEREPDAIERLWDVFQAAVAPDPWTGQAFADAFDRAIGIRGAGFKLTIGLFWIRPTTFLNLDSPMREYLHISVASHALTAVSYKKHVDDLRARDPRPFYEISQAAYDHKPQPEPSNYWLVGAYWGNQDPPDLTEEFIRTGKWVNGYTDKYTDKVGQMQPGDRIAIKAATVQQGGLPFEYDKPVSRMLIKARGIITRNHGDGRTVEVEWDPNFEPRDWYFYTYRGTVWQVNRDSQFGRQLIDFVFYDKSQDYPFFISAWKEWKEESTEPPGEGDDTPPMTFTMEQAREGLFLDATEFARIVELLRSRKNLILQGPPGVGKTFIAGRIAYALMGIKDSRRVQMVQFHQTYSYEDFIQGFRPSATPGASLSFILRDGVFYEFCQRAREAGDQPHVFVIDEINRGNLSRIFGELMMLIEPDKRGDTHAIRLTYQSADDPPFYVPSNVHLLGLMNLADRSLAMVDYALRRRFVFITLAPKFDSPLFGDWLAKRGMKSDLIELIVQRMTSVNERIRRDVRLGPHFQIGHSYFCPEVDDLSEHDEAWYRAVVETQIEPLLAEYWYDEADTAAQLVKQLLQP